MLKKLYTIFGSKQKTQFFGLGIMILIGGLFETLGVSMMVPVMTAVTDPASVRDMIAQYEPVRGIAQALGILESDIRLIVTMLVFLILLFIVKNTYLLLLARRQSTFISRTRNEMISRVMREFLNRPYEDYLGADIPKMFSLVLALLNLSTELVVSICICIVLFVVNWKLTAFVAVIFLLMTGFNLKVLKPRLNEIGRANQNIQSRIAKWRIEAI